MEFETFSVNICGIPATVDVTIHNHGYPDSYDEPGCGPEFTYDVCDRRGRPAPWLERKMTMKDHAELSETIVDRLDGLK